MWQRLRDGVDHIARESPARLALAVFAIIILVLTALLQIPAATTTGVRAPFIDSLFTATSAVCVTGLVTVDTAVFWSPLGQFFIAIGMMVGGLGVMTLASILATAVSRHIGLTQRFLTAEETHTGLGEVGSLVRAVVVVSLSAHAVLFVVLVPFFLRQGEALLMACWHAFFMGASIFNNGGFVIMPEGLGPHVGDWTLTIPIILGTVVGAIGFPVILDMWRHKRRTARWSLTTKISLITYATLLVLGFLAIGLFEWGNSFQDLSISERINAALLQSTTARSSGLATVPIHEMSQSTWFILDALMFVGG